MRWLAVLPVLLAAGAAGAQSWPQWRGPNRSGLTMHRSGWDGARWPLTLQWQAEAGRGMGASPIIVDGKVYVMGRAGQADQLLCLALADGKPLWRQECLCRADGRFRHGESAEGPTCTATFDPRTGFLFTLGNDGDLCCWDSSRAGRAVWQVNLYDAYKVPARRSTAETDPRRDYGYTGNVLVWGNAAIVEVGSPTEGNTMAFDTATGRRLWASQDASPAGHNCGPVMLWADGVPCVASFTLEGLRVMRADAGREGQSVAWLPWVMPFNVNCPTPCVAGDTVILTGTAAYDSRKKTTFLRIGPAGIVAQWQGERQSYVCSPVAHKAHVYLYEDRLSCLEIATGKLAWEGGEGLRGVAGSIAVTGDDKVVLWACNTMVLAESAVGSPRAYKELARLADAIPGDAGDCYPHVAVGEGHVVVKSKTGRMACYAMPPATTAPTEPAASQAGRPARRAAASGYPRRP